VVKAVRRFTPILTPLLSNRPLCRAIAGASVIHLGLVSLHLPSWPCPLRHGLGMPCPGCGLTRGMMALMRGHWHQAIEIHAFAPLAIAVVAIIGYVSIAPAGHWRWMVQHCQHIERKTGASAALVTLFILYWLTRLFLFRKAFYHLVL
jgi:hypothetical protein